MNSRYFTVQIIKSAFILCFSVFLSTSHAQSTGTVRDKYGNVMRGTPMIIAKQWQGATNFAIDTSNWKTLKDSSINTVRLCWVGPWVADRMDEPGSEWITGVWTMSELANVVDSCVALANRFDMNVIINYHNVGEQEDFENVVNIECQNMDRLMKFWTKIAPRYNGNSLVFYEITNEPWTFGSGYTEEPFMSKYLEVYDTIRALAPQQQLLMFSFNSMNWDFPSIMTAYGSYIDWNYTSIAYHMYSTDTSSPVLALSQKYRVICTEYFYESEDFQWDLVRKVDGYEYNAETLEVLGHSWCDWRKWTDTSFELLFGELYPDARSKGYAWWLVGDSD